MRKYIPYIVLIIFFIVSIILLIIPTKNKDEKILYYRKNYNIHSLTNNNDYLNVEIMINNDKSYLIDKNQMVHSYLTDKDLTSIIDLELVDIVNFNETVEYNKETFYKNTFIFKILFNSDSHVEWYIEDALLMLGYNGNKKYELRIGNVSLIKLEENESIVSFSNIKPIITKINKNNYMTGIILGIRGTNNEVMKLNNIRVLNIGMHVGNNVIKLDNLPEDISFNDIVGYDYINLKKGTGIVSFNINKETTYYFIPIYYDNLIVSNYFPIEFTIIKNNNTYKYYLHSFKYFDLTEYTISENDIYVQDIL